MLKRLNAMRFPLSICLVPMTGLLLMGCLSADPAKFETQVRKWVPIGTSVADAQRIMEHHGFECRLITTNNLFNSGGFDYLDCDQEQVRFHDWSARFILQDGRVSEYDRIKTN